MSESKTPSTEEIISDLENDLQHASEAYCSCGEVTDRPCRACGRHIRAISKAEKSIGEIESERDQLRARVAELEKHCKNLIHACYVAGTTGTDIEDAKECLVKGGSK